MQSLKHISINMFQTFIVAYMSCICCSFYKGSLNCFMRFIEVSMTDQAVYGARMISRHIFKLQTGQNGFCKMAKCQSF